MELSNDMILDIALNAAGYIAAGFLAIVIYSMFGARRRKRQALAPAVRRTKARPESKAIDAEGQFISLAGTPSAPPTTPVAAATKPAARRRTDYGDRADVVRIAKEMLKAGASSERIQRLLPISEAELMLLNCQEN